MKILRECGYQNYWLFTAEQSRQLSLRTSLFNDGHASDDRKIKFIES